MKSVKDEELELLVTDLLEVYGYDFTNYARASLKRRVNRLAALDKFPSFAEFRYRLRNDPEYLKRFVEEITVNVTEMFRDPAFYKKLRDEVLPVLATYPLIRIWHAGCSTGEEVYSMSILLTEMGLLHKALLYATDLNPDVLEAARAGIFPLTHMKLYSENYIASGGTKEFSSYYTAKYDRAKFKDTLKTKMVYATHNLVSDKSFNEFQLILCRNVLIYFDKDLQEKVLTLFDGSLETLGFLALGSKETLRFSGIGSKYKQLEGEKIWRKTK
ncbi:MAG: methyltransferase, CheR-type [Flaviaesturariibacter sp.]|nr:methyltransferase, CheR-type [Flaviaesturariibacter sp.]